LEKELKFKGKKFGITQEKLSEIIDVSPSYICEIEKGGSISSLATISKIARTLDISLDYLVFGINKNNLENVVSKALESLPEKNQRLYFALCENIANVIKDENQL